MAQPETDFARIIAEHAAAAAAALAAKRQSLLPRLRAAGCTSIEIAYEGYGDSGNVESVTPQPEGASVDEVLMEETGDFGWSFAYSQHPGFENNEGGFGTLTWHLETDRIDLSHANRYVACDHIDREGL